MGDFCPVNGLMVAAQDGVLPEWLFHQNKRDAPVGVLIAQMVFVWLLCTLFLVIPSFNTSYWILSDLTAEFALIFYILFCSRY